MALAGRKPSLFKTANRIPARLGLGASEFRWFPHHTKRLALCQRLMIFLCWGNMQKLETICRDTYQAEAGFRWHPDRQKWVKWCHSNIGIAPNRKGAYSFP